MTLHAPPRSNRLLLVYNADSGIINALIHAVHKQLFPETYPCSLCAITYGAVSMRGEWKHFLDALPLEVVFHHKDDFAEAYPAMGEGAIDEVTLPAILIAQGSKAPRVLVPTAELDAMADTTELMERVEEKLAKEFLGSLPTQAIA